MCECCLSLDVARETYRENVNDVNEFRDGLKSELDLDISLVNTDKGEFLLECSKEDWAEKGREVYSLFTNIVSLLTFFRLSTFKSARKTTSTFARNGTQY